MENKITNYILVLSEVYRIVLPFSGKFWMKTEYLQTLFYVTKLYSYILFKALVSNTRKLKFLFWVISLWLMYGIPSRRQIILQLPKSLQQWLQLSLHSTFTTEATTDAVDCYPVLPFLQCLSGWLPVCCCDRRPKIPVASSSLLGTPAIVSHDL